MKRKYKIILAVVAAIIIFGIYLFVPGPENEYFSSRIVNAPAGAVWKVVGDVGNFHKYNPGLKHSQVVSGTGKGMVRSCTNAAGSWSETCSEWKEGESYTFDVHTNAKDYPFPFKSIKGQWLVKAIDSNRSEITTKFLYRFKYRIDDWLYNSATQKQFATGTPLTFDSWEKAINSK